VDDPVKLNEETRVLADVGGPVDETRVTLAVYGEDLDPTEVTRLLGCQPTQVHRKGDKRHPTSVPYQTGAWFFTLETKAPSGPDELIPLLLRQLPGDSAFWAGLRERYDVQIRVAIHTAGWNRGFDISPATAELIAATGASLGFDLYFYEDDEQH
jgi:hypothetical protein